MLRRLVPDTLAGRTIIILLFGLSLFHLWSIWIYQSGIEDLLGTTREEQLSERLISVKRVIEALPERAREQTAHALSTASMEIHWSPRALVNPPATQAHKTALVRQRLRELVPELGDDQVRLAFADEGGSRAAADAAAFHHLLLASVQFTDGTWLNVSVATLHPAAVSDHSVLGSLTAMALGILIVSVFLVRSVTAPLRALARAADRIGVDAATPDLPQSGPREVRLAATAFNRMHERIKRLIHERTQTLAAVSHDLKTPITRLRLRAHFVPDVELRDTIESDLDEMESMIQLTLDFLRGDASGEEIRAVDIGTIIESVCDSFADSGHDVVLRAEVHAPLSCRPLALKRAFSNLVDNAVKYGRRARVALEKRTDELVVVIDDDGPGIAEAELERVSDPFYRLEASRSRETGGTGLGLTVVRSTICAHGGDVRLSNRPGGGLRATVTLPLSPQLPRPATTS